MGFKQENFLNLFMFIFFISFLVIIIFLNNYSETILLSLACFFIFIILGVYKKIRFPKGKASKRPDVLRPGWWFFCLVSLISFFVCLFAGRALMSLFFLFFGFYFVANIAKNERNALFGLIANKFGR